ncbi:uncharacterized protein LOC122059622 isoform X2 [Macadamia integrifolia]|uniref:uncharacterized protein LOC122059622 isoform X2 n=1 Tax=Macadamia integrifolia TaxID=60698 RepID=UPI001C530212|nr:uncharacterized protein LOC122059622 isoform X2 [Macadamia integrifolia]
MRNSWVFTIFLVLFSFYIVHFRAEAAPAGPLIKHLSSFLKWTRSSPKTPQTDGNVVQFENGYLVETVVEGNELGVVPYSIRVSHEGELFAVDAVNSNIVRITPPLSQYSRARLVAGSFKGYSGHVDGKPSDARFNHPKGVTMDDKGNVYVADTSNLAIRKIGEAGVKTIAGGKSNVAGYRDGPSEDAKFSSDFDVVYDGRTCSLLVVDRGNAAIRQISLQQEDCDYQYNSISTTDVMLVIGAVLVGYLSCMLHQGFGLSVFSRSQQTSEGDLKGQATTEKPSLIVESLKEEPDARWPSFGNLVIDLFKLAMEALGSIFLYFIPVSLRTRKSKGDLTPLKDSLVMPEDGADEPPLVQKHRSATPLSETRHSPSPNASGDGYTQHKLQKSKSAAPRDASLSSKHRSSKRQEYAEFYGSAEVPPYSQFGSKSLKERTGSAEVPPYGQFGSKSQKERIRHRHRERSGEVVFGATGTEPKPVEIKSVDYGDPKFDHFNIRSKYGSEDAFHF